MVPSIFNAFTCFCALTDVCFFVGGQFVSKTIFFFFSIVSPLATSFNFLPHLFLFILVLQQPSISLDWLQLVQDLLDRSIDEDGECKEKTFFLNYRVFEAGSKCVECVFTLWLLYYNWWPCKISRLLEHGLNVFQYIII